MQPEGEDRHELRDHLRVLRHRKWTIVLLTILVVAAAVGASLAQTAIYQASADVLLHARTTESILDPTIAQTESTLEAPTEIRVLESEPVRRIVQRRIGNAPPVSVTNPTDTDFLVVAAESPDPKRAAEVANAYAKAYVDFRREEAVNDIESAITQLERKVRELDRQVLAGAADVTAPGPTSTQVSPGQPDTASESLARKRTLFAGRIDELRLAATQQTGGAQQVSRAEAPSTPVRPTPVRNAVLALFVGLVLGMGLAFLREHLDDSLKTKDDVERMVPGVPVLGLIPALTVWKDKRSAFVVSIADPSSPAAEAYRALRTAVQFLGLERSLRTLHVTSPSAAEGKSTTIANLAVAMASAGRRVIVVDADLRRPRLHNFFALRQDVGLTSVLLGETTLDNALQQVPGVAGLSLLASGPLPPNPSELLAGARCAERLRELADRCDLVLVDCPPVLPVTDATVLASRVDGTLLVVNPSKTERRKLRRAVEMLGHVDASLLGVVLNAVTGESAYGYGGGYRYRYAPKAPKPSRVSEADARNPVATTRPRTLAMIYSGRWCASFRSG